MKCMLELMHCLWRELQ